MRTYVGVLVLIAVAAGLAGILWWFSGTVEPKTIDPDAGMYETLDLSNKCDIEDDTEWNDCCKSSCNDFCEEYDQESVKHFANLHLCTCWCE